MKYKKVLLIVVIALTAVVAVLANFMLKSYDGPEAVRIYIPGGSTSEAVRDTLRLSLGDYGSRVYDMWKVMGGDAAKAHGSYVVQPASRAFATARAIAKGRQTPVKVTVNNVRTFEDLTERIAAKLDFSALALDSAFADTLSRLDGFAHRAAYPAAVVPDTYEFYWTASPGHVVAKLLDRHNDFWTDDRLAKAKAMGLNPVQVATVASIAEEESNKADERPTIARLYLNRLDKGMKLQADPTVKFAVSDFTIRRITGRYLNEESPYNTYKYAGLPPGPIRIAEAATIDAVLNAPRHNYLYMCAKEDFSGRHNFATDYATHQANARRYQSALNSRGIK